MRRVFAPLVIPPDVGPPLNKTERPIVPDIDHLNG